MDILKFATYDQKGFYFTFICFVLGLMDGSWANVSTPLLSSKSLQKTFVETVPILYPMDFIYFGRSIIQMVSHSDLLSEIYSLLVELRGISVQSYDFYITGHPKYDTKNT